MSDFEVEKQGSDFEVKTLIKLEEGARYWGNDGLRHGPLVRAGRVFHVKGYDTSMGLWTSEGLPCFNEGVPQVQLVRRADTVGGTKPEGRKDDAAKDRFELLPGDALRAIAVILTFGAAKYGDRNWENGMKWSRVYGALQRHLTDWWEGAPPDVETGKSHLWHAGCCLLFLIAYEIRSVGEDDRPGRP